MARKKRAKDAAKHSAGFTENWPSETRYHTGENAEYAPTEYPKGGYPTAKTLEQTGDVHYPGGLTVGMGKADPHYHLGRNPYGSTPIESMLDREGEAYRQNLDQVLADVPEPIYKQTQSESDLNRAVERLYTKSRQYRDNSRRVSRRLNMEEDLQNQKYEMKEYSKKVIKNLEEKRLTEYAEKLREESKAPRYEQTEKLQRNHLLPYGYGLPPKSMELESTFMEPTPGLEIVKKKRIQQELEDVLPPSPLDGVKSTLKSQHQWYYEMLRDREIKEQKELSTRLKNIEEEEKTFSFQPKINQQSLVILDRVAKRDAGLIAPRQKLRDMMGHELETS